MSSPVCTRATRPERFLCANEGAPTAASSAKAMANRKTFDSTLASLFKWSPFAATIQQYNDILERAGRSRVESTMCVCYELMQTAGGHRGILLMEGRRVRFSLLISVSIIFL